jgi:iron complex transport system permease protein
MPHVVRLWLGADHRLLLPLSWIGGAAALLLADGLARLMVMPAELPVGVITSLVGGPFFLWLLLGRRNHAR